MSMDKSLLKEILDRLAHTSWVCVKKEQGMEKAQISNMIGVYRAYGLDVLKVFIMRQVKRRTIGRDAGLAIIEDLEQLEKKAADLDEAVTSYLGLLRWYYDIQESREIKARSLEELLKAWKR